MLTYEFKRAAARLIKNRDQSHRLTAAHQSRSGDQLKVFAFDQAQAHFAQVPYRASLVAIHRTDI